MVNKLDENFERTMKALDLAACTAFKNICNHFRGNQTWMIHPDIMTPNSLKDKVGKCNFSLFPHLDFFF